jgi:hypothetical protein
VARCAVLCHRHRRHTDVGSRKRRYRFAQRAIVLNDEGVFESLGTAIALRRRHLGTAALLWLISVGLTLGVGFAMLFIVVLLAIPIAIVLIVLGALSGPLLTVLLGVPLGLLAFAALWFVGSLAGAFLSAYWTLAYLRLTRPQTAPLTSAT